MKNMFLKWVIFSLWFCLTIWAFILTYAAWINLSNVTTSDTLTATWWNNIISNINDLKTTTDTLSTTINNLSWSIPTWSIMAFYLTTCPTWWNAADGTNSTPDLRWQFLRWLNTFNNWVTIRNDWYQDPTNRTLWNHQADDFKSHTHTTYAVSGPYKWEANWWGWVLAAWQSGASGWAETRPKNVAVIFCIKN